MKKVVSFFLFVFLLLPSAAKADSVYDRVIKSGTIKCGYFLYPPVVMKDPNTGEFSGIFYEYVEALAKNLSLKVDWVEEIGLADYPAALESGRIDAMCAGIWIRGSRARVHDYVSPVYYLPLYVYVREGDNRFDKNPFILNNPEYTLAIMEGGATETVRQELFPDSKAYTLSQLTNPSELYLSLAQKKADAIIYDPFSYELYNKANPNVLRRASNQRMKMFPNAIPVKRGEEEFRRMLSLTTEEMHLSGEIGKIISKYDTVEGSIFQPALPFKE